MTESIRILGIDPGLRHTGWGIIESQGNSLSFIAAGTVDSDKKLSMSDRLKQIHDGLFTVIESHKPQESAVECTFINMNAKIPTMKLGQARSIAMLVPALFELTVAEYAPNLIKKTVVGTGHCEKQQIRMMVKILLPKANLDSDDAADALAIAICHAQHRKGLEHMAQREKEN